MSHVATIEIEVKDLEALKAAAADLGLEFREGQTTYNWFGQHMGDYPVPEGFTPDDLGKCEHAICFPTDQRQPGYESYDPYQVGITARRDGKPGYTLLWDFFCDGFGLQNAIGANGQKLVQRYAVNVAKRQAMKQGYACREAVKQDGSVSLELTRRPGR